MGCGGFTCSKNALLSLNVLYILVAFILIGVAAYAKAIAIIVEIKLIGGVIACGVFLLLIAIIGLIGAVKHNQILLFFYMIVLFLLFIIQFAVACACLALNESGKKLLAEKGWEYAGDKLKASAQNKFKCCGFNDTTPTDAMPHPACSSWSNSCKDKYKDAPCCTGIPSNITTACPQDIKTCWTKFHEEMSVGLRIAGGVGLFFSFTEVVGVWLSLRFRNQKDPSADPSQFL